MTVEALLDRLHGVRRTGPDRWIARCPSHTDKSPSFSIRELDDGRVLLHCFAGCDVEQVLGAVGLGFDALFPERPIDHAPRERRPFLPADVFEIARVEIGVAAIIAADLHKTRAVSEADYERLFLVVARLGDIAGAAYGR